MTRLSVLIPTLDEERNLPECLASCAFADQIVVVDSGSTDRTAEIARDAGATLLVHPFESHARQKNWALPQVAHDWVLLVDADERVTAELQQEIRAVLADPGERRGFRMRRLNTFLGRTIVGCGWQNDWVLRLLDRRVARFEDRRVHEGAVVEGATGALAAKLVHHSCRDLSEWLRKTDWYARLGAEEAFARGRRARPGDLAARPLGRFVKQWLLQGGFRDGPEGWLLCATSAYSVLLKYAYLRELAKKARAL
ncbi:MAG: glycosyltransferase family 2 protein [bacterium]